MGFDIFRHRDELLVNMTKIGHCHKKIITMTNILSLRQKIGHHDEYFLIVMIISWSWEKIGHRDQNFVISMNILSSLPFFATVTKKFCHHDQKLVTVWQIFCHHNVHFNIVTKNWPLWPKFSNHDKHFVIVTNISSLWTYLSGGTKIGIWPNFLDLT